MLHHPNNNATVFRRLFEKFVPNHMAAGEVIIGAVRERVDVTVDLVVKKLGS
jgi:hypothetical protein